MPLVGHHSFLGEIEGTRVWGTMVCWAGHQGLQVEGTREPVKKKVKGGKVAAMIRNVPRQAKRKSMGGPPPKEKRQGTVRRKMEHGGRQQQHVPIMDSLFGRMPVSVDNLFGRIPVL